MASRSLGSLTIDLIAKVGGFVQGMDRAARAADKRLKEIERRAKIAGAAIGTALVAGAAVLARNLQTTIDRMDEVSKAAQRAQLPTEQFSQLAYAASLADVSMQDITTSMGRLARAQADAMRGSKEQEDAFKRLGIEFKNADGTLRDSRDVFLDFADAYRKFQGQPEILATGMQIFGRSFQNLIPLLKGGREGLQAAADEADRLGITLSTEAGQQAEEFNDNITRLKTAISGLSQTVASELLPDLVQMTDETVKWIKEGSNAKDLALEIADALRALADTAKLFGGLLDQLGKLRSMLVSIEQFGAKINPNSWFGGNNIVANFMQERFPALYRQIGSGDPSTRRPAPGPTMEMDPTLGAPLTPDEQARLRITPRPTGGGGASKAEAEARRRAQEAMREQERAREELRRQIEAVQDARREFEAWSAQLAGPVADANYQFARDMERLNELAREGEIAADDLTKAQAQLRKEHEANLESIEARLNPGRQMLEDLEFELALLKMTNAERATAIQLRGMDAEQVRKYGDAIAEANKRIEEEMEAADWMDGIRYEFQGFFEDVIGGTKSVSDAFRDMLDNIAAQITSRIAEGWVEKLFGAAGTSGGGSAGGWWAALGSIFGGGKATGGWGQPNRLYEVNEQGLEMATVRGRDYLLTGASGAQITPAHRVGGGGRSITQIFNNPVMSNLQTDSQRARREARKVQRDTARA